MVKTTPKGNNQPSEKAIVNAIKRYLDKLPGCYVIKTYGSVYSAGQPDLLGCFQGRTLALEVKRPGGKPTKLQMAMLKKWEAAGAIAAVVHSVEEVKGILIGGSGNAEQAKG
jgi:Holliday junction resolvase